MSDSFRRFAYDDDNLASTTRADVLAWRAFVKRTRGHAHRVNAPRSERAPDDIHERMMDAREGYYHATRAK